MKSNHPGVAPDTDAAQHAEFDTVAGRRGTLTAVARRIAERTDPDYVILFGSQARNDAGEFSDIDVMVVKDTDELHELAHEAEEAVEDLGERVDVVSTTPAQLANCETAASAVYEDAMRDGRVLFSRQLGIESGERRGDDGIVRTAPSRETKTAWMKQNARERAEGALTAAAERLHDLELAHPETSTTTYLMIASQAVEQSFKAVMVAKGERRVAGHSLHEQARRLEESGEKLPEGIGKRELKGIAEGGNQGRYSEWVDEEKITKTRASEIAHAIYGYSRRRVRALLANDLKPGSSPAVPGQRGRADQGR